MSADPKRPPEKKAYGVKDLVALAERYVVRPVWDLVARRAWCRRQRRALRRPGHSVVWIHAPSVRWAEWGARRGYFEMLHMGTLPYLRGAGAPIV